MPPKRGRPSSLHGLPQRASQRRRYPDWGAFPRRAGLQTLMRGLLKYAAPAYHLGQRYMSYRGRAPAKKSTPVGGSMTRGYSGRPFRKAKWKKSTKHSVSLTVESGGAHSDADCVYLGHAVAPERALLTFCYGVVHKLFTKSGARIASMQERWQGETLAAHANQSCVLGYQYMVEENATRASRSLTLGADATFADVADQLRADIETVTNGNDELFKMMSCYLRFIDPVTANVQQVLASIALDDTILSFSFYSSLSLQNQTVGTASTDDQLTDVTNNPLEGRVYEGYGSGLTPKFYNATAALGSTNNFQPTYQEGLILFDPTGTNVTTQMQTIFRRPPSARAFDQKVKSGVVKLQPGQVKKGILKYDVKMSVNQFFKRMSPWLRTHNTDTIAFQVGKCQVYALEKLCRTGQQGVGQAVTVGCELNQTYRCSLFQRKVQTMADHIVP